MGHSADDAAHFAPDLVQKALALFEVNEAARDDVGILQYLPAISANCRDYHHHSFLRECQPVTENHFAHIADAQSVHHHVI